MKLTKKDWLGMFAMTGEEKRMLAVLLALAVLGLIGRYYYLYGRVSRPYVPAGLPATSAPAKRVPVEE